MIVVHEPVVVLTDLGLALLGAWCAWRLRPAAGAGGDARPMLLMAGLASAALWGAVFHGFFSVRTGTFGGALVWLAVALSIVWVACTLLSIGLSVRAARLRDATRETIVLAYCAIFTAIVVFIDSSFRTIVGFYGPVLLATLAVAGLEAARTRELSWALVTAGLAVSAVAAVLQVSGVALHPEFFDHNAVYHVVQAGALILLYLGFRRMRVAR